MNKFIASIVIAFTAFSANAQAVMDDGYSTVITQMLQPTYPIDKASDDGTFIDIQKMIAEKDGTVLPADPYLMDDGYADVIIEMLKSQPKPWTSTPTEDDPYMGPRSSVMDDGYSVVVIEMLQPKTFPLFGAADDGTFIGVQQLIAEATGTVLPADQYLMDDGYADVIRAMVR